ncbi:MAG: prolyl oligopeptidase family serine peptidase [Caldithrix sp.]|nr:prolyl oligopeptidase family serine peptidase [Caldithrix sp.]
MHQRTAFKRMLFGLLLTAFLTMATTTLTADPLKPADVLNLEYVTSAKISPDGQHIAYTLRVPRDPGDKPGGAWYELHVVNTETGQSRPFITGEVNISSIQWHPDGSSIAFRARRGEQKRTQVWMIPVDGGEARAVTDHETSVSSFEWHPDGKHIAFIAIAPKSEKAKTLDDKGYNFIYYEEEWRYRNLYMTAVDMKNLPVNSGEPLTGDITVWDFTFAPDGEKIAFSASQRNLIDDYYMFRHIHILDLDSKEHRQLTDNPGKLGNYRFSPDGSDLAYTAAKTRSDHAVSQVYVIPVEGGSEKNLTPKNFIGHVDWVGWKDNDRVVYRAGEKTATTLSVVNKAGGQRQVIQSSLDNGGIIFYPPDYTDDFKHFAMLGQTPHYPLELFYWQPGEDLKRLTNVNPWLKDKHLGKQEVVQYQARDGVTIEGLLIKPVDYEADQSYPMVVFVHGGPESHYSNGWVTRYATPGQVLAGKGYAVFYPNYRASTGYGLEFAAAGYNDAAGTEFDDIADGIKHFIDTGLADEQRIGLAGGSYGGFAAAWFSSYYTDLVKATGMFVGISDLISKRGTTDIPYEELYVHSGKKLEEMWRQSLQRSPIYHAHKNENKTAVLIFGGAEDSRVHPSQSIEFYRRLKMNDHKAVRLVQYPGEGHGNRRQPGRIDVLYRTINWYDWYVKDGKPVDGPMPPLDISDQYGLDLPE